jgi:hypothetical protein
MVAVQRIYGTVDNPYTPTIAFLMLTWVLHKISVFDRMVRAGTSTSSSLRALDIFLDCLVLSLLLFVGVVIQVRMICMHPSFMHGAEPSV